MTIYPVEFHRRLEQKWASRIEQILTDVATLPRNPSDDDDDDDEEDEDEKDLLHKEWNSEFKVRLRRACGLPQ